MQAWTSNAVKIADVILLKLYNLFRCWLIYIPQTYFLFITCQKVLLICVQSQRIYCLVMILIKSSNSFWFVVPPSHFYLWHHDFSIFINLSFIPLFVLITFHSLNLDMTVISVNDMIGILWYLGQKSYCINFALQLFWSLLVVASCKWISFLFVLVWYAPS